jgi:hypothetical protein
MKNLSTAILACAAFALLSVPAVAQSPKATESIAIGGKSITIKYSAPSVRGRQIFGDGGLISHDPNYPVWRAGANSATAFHTDADLDINGLSVPAGDYTLYVLVKDPDNWELIINKQTGQWGLTYSQAQDLGRVKMTMAKPATPVEVCKYTLTDLGNKKAKLDLSWEKHSASVTVTVK